MKRISYVLIGGILAICLYSCGTEDLELLQTCGTDNPSLVVDLNATQQLRFNSSVFYERQGGGMRLSATQLQSNCRQIASLSLFFELRLGQQELVPRPNSRADGETISNGQTTLFELDDDALLASFDPVEGEARVFEIITLAEDEIEGTITATYAKRGNPGSFSILPDTIFFNTVPFRAIRVEQANQ